MLCGRFSFGWSPLLTVPTGWIAAVSSASGTPWSTVVQNDTAPGFVIPQGYSVFGVTPPAGVKAVNISFTFFSISTMGARSNAHFLFNVQFNFSGTGIPPIAPPPPPVPASPSPPPPPGFLTCDVLDTWFRYESPNVPYSCFKCVGECNYDYTYFNSTTGIATMGAYTAKDTWSQTVKVIGGNYYVLAYVLSVATTPNYWRTSVSAAGVQQTLAEFVDKTWNGDQFFSHLFQVPSNATNSSGLTFLTISFTNLNENAFWYLKRPVLINIGSGLPPLPPSPPPPVPYVPSCRTQDWDTCPSGDCIQLFGSASRKDQAKHYEGTVRADSTNAVFTILNVKFAPTSGQARVKGGILAGVEPGNEDPEPFACPMKSGPAGN
eukprot:jgi/Botrbrau1/17065/Bobra.0329s0002.1